VGQGVIADRTRENLRSSDIGITMMRRRFFAELDAIKEGREPNGIIRDPEAAACIELPNIARELNTQGIRLEEFCNHPLLRRRLTGFPFHFGQPPQVREAFERAMNIR
jgi:5,5'-dehydrodivanillate O-demethylase